MDQVRRLRAEGRSPKEIARLLGLRPAAVAPIVRTLAREEAAAAPEPAVTGCWVSRGWNTRLTVSGHEDWPTGPSNNPGAEGLACVVVARRHKPQRLTVCGYLVDVFCLGVKNTIGPRIMNDRELPGFLEMFFNSIHLGQPPLDAPLDLAQHLVLGAVDHARALGFEPHADFRATAAQLGAWQETSAITFGRDGVPNYISGPDDNPNAIMRTLRKTVGDGNFHFTTGISPDW